MKQSVVLKQKSDEIFANLAARLGILPIRGWIMTLLQILISSIPVGLLLFVGSIPFRLLVNDIMRDINILSDLSFLDILVLIFFGNAVGIGIGGLKIMIGLLVNRIRVTHYYRQLIYRGSIIPATLTGVEVKDGKTIIQYSFINPQHESITQFYTLNGNVSDFNFDSILYINNKINIINY